MVYVRTLFHTVVADEWKLLSPVCGVKWWKDRTKKIKGCCTPFSCVDGGSRLPSLGRWAYWRLYHGVSNAWRVWCSTYGYLPSHSFLPQLFGLHSFCVPLRIGGWVEMAYPWMFNHSTICLVDTGQVCIWRTSSMLTLLTHIPAASNRNLGEQRWITFSVSFPSFNSHDMVSVVIQL